MSPDQTTTRQGALRREEILKKAIDVFGEAGYAGARIDEVARRVGIRRPSILYHFPDKHSLYSAAISDVVHDIVARVLATEDQPGDRLEAIANTWIDFVIARPNSARVLLRQMIDVDPVAIEGTEAPVQALLSSIQTAIDDSIGSEVGKTMDASEFVLILSSTSLVWVASQSAIEGAFGLDTLSPQSIQRHRRILYALTRHLLAAADEASVPRAVASRKP